ncbi:MAG: FKBP-type peptidyl-prolyl cis-trans isomerase [Alphaproteobacteria bacterium]|nr:FKBP-type peptidyl-prolyl cis-trans isomerase [Alphaproteobacteria bacterium]
MKKFAAIAGICAAFGLTACDAGATAKEGDTVIINFAGYLDGVQFPGGTAEKFPLKLGSGQFVPGFEDQVIGMKEGEERDINITFPEQYVPDLAGKAVVFKVKLIDIVEK